jgi:tetratricopeptide (TPR) repeat protein
MGKGTDVALLQSSSRLFTTTPLDQLENNSCDINNTMGKKGGGGNNAKAKRARPSGGNNGNSNDAGGVGWSSSDHAMRKAKQRSRLSEEKLVVRERRAALLTRDSREKREEGKLRLHMKRVQRQLDKLRERLEVWDDVEEARRWKEQQQEEERKRREEEGPLPKKKKGRLGPETWKLKGAARPAWQVYDFDTRYVDPHQKAHEEAAKKVARQRNILEFCKGRFGVEDDPNVPQPQCREYLSLLMQLGLLSMQANQLKTARKAFLDCMELDSMTSPITPARSHLMRLYMEANRPESARRLWEKLPTSDPSVWIRYSAALIEFVSWRVLEEKGSTQETAEFLLGKAIHANRFCALYLAFSDTFDQAMEHTDEIEDADDNSPLEQAIEYCNSEQMGAWKGTDGALDWIRSVVLRLLAGGKIGCDNAVEVSAHDLDWRENLKEMRDDEAHIQEQGNKGDNGDGQAYEDEDDGTDDDNDVDDDESVVDSEMFRGMFELAMEMVESSGQLKVT